MNKILKQLSDSIYDTYLKYAKQSGEQDIGAKHAYSALNHLYKEGNYTAFTRENNSRLNLIKALDKSNPQAIILEQFLNLMKNPQNKFKDSKLSIMQKSILSTYNKYGKDHVLAAMYKLINDNNYSGFTRGNTLSNNNYRTNLQNNISPEEFYNAVLSGVVNTSISEHELDSNLTQDVEQTFPAISNFQTYPSFNLCKQDIIHGIHPHHEEYNLDNMYACIDVGNIRSSQEDSVLLLQHPDNPKFKMLAVADGMGGYQYGEKASNMVLYEIMEWFENLDPRLFYNANTKTLQNLLSDKLIEINNRVCDTFLGRSGSTFVGAITTDKNTIVSNIGDSRAYVVDNHGELYQLSEDHSYLSDELYKKGLEQFDEFDPSKREQVRQIKNDFRFNRKSNVVKHAIGVEQESDRDFVSSTSIDNKSYSTLLLCSDGVTDCLSDHQLMAITRQTPKSELAKRIVETVKSTDSYRKYSSEGYANRIPAGKDNTTAAVLDNDSER